MSRKPALLAPILLLLSCFLLTGCQGKTAPKSAAAEEFRKEVEAAARGLVQALAGPMARGDRDAVRKVLSSERAKALSARNPLTPQAIILDRKGVVYECDVPFVCEVARDYSRIDLVARALKGKGGTHGKLYAANDKEIFLVLMPIPPKGEKEGLLGLVYDVEGVRRARGVTEKEFLEMSFSI